MDKTTSQNKAFQHFFGRKNTAAAKRTSFFAKYIALTTSLLQTEGVLSPLNNIYNVSSCLLSILITAWGSLYSSAIWVRVMIHPQRPSHLTALPLTVQSLFNLGALGSATESKRKEICLQLALVGHKNLAQYEQKIMSP